MVHTTQPAIFLKVSPVVNLLQLRIHLLFIPSDPPTAPEAFKIMHPISNQNILENISPEDFEKFITAGKNLLAILDKNLLDQVLNQDVKKFFQVCQEPPKVEAPPPPVPMPEPVSQPTLFNAMPPSMNSSMMQNSHQFNNMPHNSGIRNAPAIFNNFKPPGTASVPAPQNNPPTTGTFGRGFKPLTKKPDFSTDINNFDNDPAFNFNPNVKPLEVKPLFPEKQGSKTGRGKEAYTSGPKSLASLGKERIKSRQELERERVRNKDKDAPVHAKIVEKSNDGSTKVTYIDKARTRARPESEADRERLEKIKAARPARDFETDRYSNRDSRNYDRDSGRYGRDRDQERRDRRYNPYSREGQGQSSSSSRHAHDRYDRSDRVDRSDRSDRISDRSERSHRDSRSRKAPSRDYELDSKKAKRASRFAEDADPLVKTYERKSSKDKETREEREERKKHKKHKKDRSERSDLDRDRSERKKRRRDDE